MDAAPGSDGSSVENSPDKPKKKKGKKKLLDREDYSASIYSSDDESEGGTDASSVVPDEPLVHVVKKANKRGLAHDHAEKPHENYCGLCGTTHTETCHMVQNPDNLAEYRAMLMEITNNESIEIRVSSLAPGLSISYSWVIQREAVQAIDEKLLKMGKLDLIKGQSVYLADKSKKRKAPHEPDQGENITEHAEKVKKPSKPRKPRNISDLSQPWKVLNRKPSGNPLTSTIPSVLSLPTAVDLTTIASGSKEPGPFISTDPLRLPKKAKVSTFSAFSTTGDGVCPLCGGPKHRLRDCLAPKGGVEK